MGPAYNLELSGARSVTTIQHPRSKELEALSVKASRAFVDEGLHGIEAEVVVVLDVSPRMAPLYADGTVQQLLTALLALAMKFDDDGVVPVWTYADEARLVGKIRRDDYVSWVDKNLQPPALLRPGMKLPPSRFAPFIDAIAQRYFPREWATPPTTRQVGERLKRTVHEYASLIEPRHSPIFVIVVTSGDCDDPMETSKLLRRASHLPIFWQFAALATTEGQVPEYRFLRGLDRLTDTHVDACGFFEAEEFRDPEALFRGLLGEFHGYVAHDLVRKMLIPPAAPESLPDDSGERLVQEVLSLPAQEVAKRERARLERERRRAERERQSAAELARAPAWPRINTEAQDLPEPEPEPEAAAAPEPEAPPAPRPRATPTTRPQPRVKRETMPYNPSAIEEPPPAAPPPRRPQPRPDTATRTFQRVPTPLPSVPEPAMVVDAEDPDDVEDTVETPAQRLMRIRARREARKHSS